MKGSGSYSLQTLFQFNDANGWYPIGTLIKDASGDLFGITQYGGPPNADGNGTVFELSPTRRQLQLSDIIFVSV